MTVLDLACGHGRISNQLAKRGCRVTGLDNTPLFLKRASQDAKQLGVEVQYIEGDMRSLPWTQHFDLIVNWFVAFGYFNDEENRQVLAEAYRALKSGGKLLIEHINKEWVVKNFQPTQMSERDGNYLIDRNHYNILTGRTENERIIIRDGKIRRSQFFVRLFTYTELRDWLLQAGFQQVNGYGREGEMLTLDSRRLILVAQK